MVKTMPFDLVADVTCFFRRRASSNAYFIMRSQPRRVNTFSWMAISRSVFLCRRPPISEYSPSLFSRMMTKSISPGRRLMRGHALEEFDGTNIHILLEPSPYRNQQAPKRDVICYIRATESTEKDGVE